MAYYMRKSGGGPKAETRRRVEVRYSPIGSHCVLVGSAQFFHKVTWPG